MAEAQGQAPWTAAAHLDGDVPRDAGWHDMKVVTGAPVGPQSDVDPDTGRRRVRWGAGAGFAEAEDCWYRAYVEACRRGLGTPTVRTVGLLGDGAEWIWRQGRAFRGLPGVEVVESIDLYPAYE